MYCFYQPQREIAADKKKAKSYFLGNYTTVDEGSGGEDDSGNAFFSLFFLQLK